jgi:N-alpha-acetyltransferase 30
LGLEFKKKKTHSANRFNYIMSKRAAKKKEQQRKRLEAKRRLHEQKVRETQRLEQQRLDEAKRREREALLAAKRDSNAVPIFWQNGAELREHESVEYVRYVDESQLGELTALIDQELSEPYSIYTYRYFIHGWPEHCYLALDRGTGKLVGGIVCALEPRKQVLRGYVAMLVVDSAYRKRGIASTLVLAAVHSLRRSNCDLVTLEAEASNGAALGLYQKLGFIREKALHKYYLTGSRAFRLKLFLKPFPRFLPAAPSVVDTEQPPRHPHPLQGDDRPKERQEQVEEEQKEEAASTKD